MAERIGYLLFWNHLYAVATAGANVRGTVFRVRPYIKKLSYSSLDGSRD
jgi:hypothetical protein